MKKITILSLFALLFVVSSTYAQKGFQLGIKGGVTFNQITTDAGSLGKNISQSYDTKTGYVVGVWGRFGDKVFLQPELLLAQKGGTIDIQNVGKVKFSYSNLDVPVLVGFRVLKIFRVNAGPVATFKLSEDQKLKDALKGLTTNDEAIKNASFGYQLGVGVKLLGINLDLRKVGSLSEISALNMSSNQFKDSGWQFTVGFKII
ncbi:porin family protein [Emticicia sp. SJ17W-69]|uniref:porin family protein n=1 Tax=Emticicia sp. SJ17W-69 TaxID=3421657 RepID=UPI003EBF07F7